MTAFGWPGRQHNHFADVGLHVTHFAAAVGAHLRKIVSSQTLVVATWSVALVGTVIVALLALRVWLQLTGETASGGIIGLGYDMSGVLQGPFAHFEPSTPIKDSGILEFSTLVAMEAYLIATMMAMTLLFSLRLTLFAAPRMVRVARSAHARHHAAAVVSEARKA